MGSATIEACLTPGGDVGESCLEVGTWKTNEEGWAGSPSRKREQARAGPGGDSHGAVHGGKDSITVCFRSSIATTLNHGYSAPKRHLVTSRDIFGHYSWWEWGLLDVAQHPTVPGTSPTTWAYGTSLPRPHCQQLRSQDAPSLRHAPR